MFICGVNLESDHDHSVLAFTDNTGQEGNGWGDSWRGNHQHGTVWSLFNDDYKNGRGWSSLQGYPGYKGENAGTYEVHLQSTGFECGDTSFADGACAGLGDESLSTYNAEGNCDGPCHASDCCMALAPPPPVYEPPPPPPPAPPRASMEEFRANACSERVQAACPTPGQISAECQVPLAVYPSSLTTTNPLCSDHDHPPRHDDCCFGLLE